MADHLTEQEQIEAIKNWFKTYWKSIVLPIATVAIGYFGWTFWQSQSEAKAARGSVKYQELIKAAETAPGAELSAQQRSQVKVLADELVSEFRGTLYADHGNLILARIAVDENELTAAEAYLQRVVDKGANLAIRELAKARLARVKIARGETDAALELVAVSGDSAYKALYAEIRGDALTEQGKADLAKTAYQEAIDALPASDFNRRSLIQLKVDGIDILAGKIPAAAEAGAASETAPAAEAAQTTDATQTPDAAQAKTETP